MNTTTSHQISAAPVAAETTISEQPEWLRPKDACKRFSISRSWLYERIAARQVKSTCVRRRGAVRGVRLINRDSLSEFIEASFMEENQ